jgi:hypothetical protein
MRYIVLAQHCFDYRHAIFFGLGVKERYMFFGAALAL